ncbi:MAG: DUF362 domain-containing protein [Syntrophobacterales bacterium]|nr:DUF362 domain-containing protein [Syntrophobacterales bacterium]
MERLCIGTVKDYDVGAIKDFIVRGFQEINFEVKGAKVLLKPNLLSGKPPEKAVTTHPAIIRAMSELLLDKGCEVHVGDSPGYESTEKSLKLSGVMSIIKQLGLSIATFDSRIIKENEGISPYRSFILGEDPDGYDAIINLPKFKSHTMMGLTLGVKNTFGFIPSKEKARWHLRAGKDRLLFAAVLIDVHNIVKPALTFLDGITGMDGEGPSNGRVRQFGLVAMCRDAYILDHVIESMVGAKSVLPISRVARRHGLIGSYEKNDFGVPEVKNFVMAKTTDTDWALPEFVKNILKNLFVKKPKLRKDLCKGCGVCVDVCPATSLSLSGGSVEFDYRTCIRCYCCQEMCPEGSIKV